MRGTLTHRKAFGTGTPPVNVGSYILPVASWVSIGIFKKSDPGPVQTLLRTLGKPEYKQAGLHYIYWDGNDDDGNPIAGTDYWAKYITHNITWTWKVIGNTSVNNHGITVMHSYSIFNSVLPVGDKLFIGESFNEGGARESWRMSIADIFADQQKQYNVLFWNNDPTGAALPNNTNRSTEYMCSDGTVVFKGGNDPYSAYSIDHPTGGTWISATNVVDDTEATLVGGTSITCGLGRTYVSSVDIVRNQPTMAITGMACNSNWLWTQWGSANEIHLYNRATGALSIINVIASFGFMTNPRKLTYHNKFGGRMFFLNGSNQLVMVSINNVTGALTRVAHTLTTQSDKISMAIDSNTDTLAIACGGVHQCVYLYDISAANPSGTHFDVVGQVGGYRTNVVAANDKFNFQDNTTGLVKGLCDPYLAYDSSSNLYVGDVGSFRLQIFNSARVYQKTVQMPGALYGVSRNMADANKIYIGPIEFDAITGQMTRNFAPHVPANFFSQGYNMFKWCSIAPNGRTYATLEEQGVAPANTYLFELSDTGARQTPTPINEPANYFGNLLTKDFKVQRIFSASYLIGGTPVIEEKQITFDGSFNPVLPASFTTVCTLQPIQAGDALLESGNTSLHGITDSGTVIIKNKEITNVANYHLIGYDSTTGVKMWSTYKPNVNSSDFPPFRGYQGWFPDPTVFERSNSVNTNTFNDVQIVDNVALLLYNGEGWKGAQTNYFNYYHTIGLALGQFGTNRVTSQAIEPCGLYSSGNGFSFRFAKTTSDQRKVNNGDESIHSAGHEWQGDGFDTVEVHTVEITPPTYEPLEGIDLMASVVFNAPIANVGNITGAVDGGGYTIQSGVNSYNKFIKEASASMDAGSNPNVTKTKNFAIASYRPSMVSHKIFGIITFNGFYGPENIDASSAIFRVLDINGKILSEIGLAQLITGDFAKLRLNGTVLINDNTQNTLVNILGVWQSFSIVTTATGCVITYGDYAPVSTTIVDPTADWNKPGSIELITKDLNTFHYGTRCIAAQARYVDYI